MPARSADEVRIETYDGPRVNLRSLFELAEDSAAELDSYIEAGRVLVAVSEGEIIGHLQLTGTGDPRQVEIKNMAVREARQGQGVGRLLIQAAVDLVAAESVTAILVATAASVLGATAVLSVCTNTAPAGLDALANAGLAAAAMAAAATAAAAATRIGVLTETPHAWGFGVSPLQSLLGSSRYAAPDPAASVRAWIRSSGRGCL